MSLYLSVQSPAGSLPMASPGLVAEYLTLARMRLIFCHLFAFNFYSAYRYWSNIILTPMNLYSIDLGVQIIELVAIFGRTWFRYSTYNHNLPQTIFKFSYNPTEFQKF